MKHVPWPTIRQVLWGIGLVIITVIFVLLMQYFNQEGKISSSVLSRESLLEYQQRIQQQATHHQDLYP